VIYGFDAAEEERCADTFPGEQYNIDSWCHYCLTGECHICKDPRAYMFMDDLHPTERTHEVIAEHLAEFIGLRYAGGDPKANWG
jgi:phospholipase/lecithinase/hemolysin